MFTSPIPCSTSSWVEYCAPFASKETENETRRLGLIFYSIANLSPVSAEYLKHDLGIADLERCIEKLRDKYGIKIRQRTVFVTGVVYYLGLGSITA